MKKKLNYREHLVEWVLKFGIMESPTDSQFSAEEVADLIIKYNSDKLSGKIKFGK